MADLTPIDLLQPCLLDRLTDHEPASTQESRESRVMSMRRYKAAVMRDISWLLEATCHSLHEEIYEFGQVATSVYNFGIPDLAGKNLRGLDATQFERRIVEALRNFEPRLLPHTIQVTIIDSEDKDSGRNLIAFEVHGEIWAKPMPESLYIRTTLDIEAGSCEVVSNG